MADPFDLRSLRMFVLIARHGGLRRAAGELGLTPSALSHRLRALEDDLGFPLFERTRANMILTPPGRALLAIDTDKLTSEYKFEPPINPKTGEYEATADEEYPHIYGTINLDSVIKVVPFPAGADGLFSLPDGVKEYS